MPLREASAHRSNLMKDSKSYDRERARALLPLLTSISAEIEERQTAIGRLTERIEALSVAPHAHQDEILRLQAEVATHKRELRYVGNELESLGCEVDENGPLTIRIPGLSGSLEKGFAWRPGEPSLRFYSADSAA